MRWWKQPSPSGIFPGLTLTLGGAAVAARQAPAINARAVMKGASVNEKQTDRRLAAQVSTLQEQIDILRQQRLALERELDTARAECNAALAREQRARADAESANQAKDRFLSVLSHEMRTPLNAVFGWAHLLRSHQLTPERAEQAVQAIARNATIHARLVSDLLDASAAVANSLRLEVRDIDLCAVVTSAVDAMRPEMATKQLHVDVQLDAPSAPMTGDPDRLRQVVRHLLTNGMKFTPTGGALSVRLSWSAMAAELVVSDTGSGIADDVLPFVFDRFRQADSTATRAHGGLGIGLSLVRHLVELHSGRVTAANRGDGPGATFTVRLPLRAAE